MNTDKNKWFSISNQTTIEQLFKNYNNPSIFQKDLINCIIQYSKKYCMEDPNIIEVGSSFGITTALLPCNFTKYLLDNNGQALRLSKIFFDSHKIKATFIESDFFLYKDNNSFFDITFNAGVIEHFNFKQRIAFIENMVRITKKGGLIIIGIPNHYSFPYRLGYLYKLVRKQWPYPKEYRIRDINSELSIINSSIELIDTIILSKSLIYSNLPRPFKSIIMKLDNFFAYQGYLKVFILLKKQ
ncbi:MAG: hypothetical protein A4E26_00091 [Methanobacterium sp. PtaU1.Bin097]|nr:MAG: hypothetical protein A4E26_00091 [Methanobacterium sp. PtaU1.Bin097]